MCCLGKEKFWCSASAHVRRRCEVKGGQVKSCLTSCGKCVVAAHLVLLWQQRRRGTVRLGDCCLIFFRR
jgi:hypothetical protein